MKRTVININEELCNGCGNCISGCHEGALQIIDGKARLISYLYCDGLGACIGECPLAAISLEEKEVEAYSETAVMEKIVSKGDDTIIAHLAHLKEHNELMYLNQGFEYLRKNNIEINMEKLHAKVSASGNAAHTGCPGAMAMQVEKKQNNETPVNVNSQLEQWPVQLHLLDPQASYLKNADLLMAADCVAYAYGNFHQRFMKNKKIAIACPKLDSNKEIYVQKLVEMIDKSAIKSLQVIIMQVPCCSGLLQLAKMAIQTAKRDIPVRNTVISLHGEILEDKFL